MARRSHTRSVASRCAVRTEQTPWGPVVKFTVPGSRDDATMALFDLGQDSDAGGMLDLGGHDLFSEFATRATEPAPVVDMAPAIESPIREAAPVATIPAQASAPAPEIIAVDVLTDVQVHYVDTPRELRDAIRAGEIADGDVYAIVRERWEATDAGRVMVRDTDAGVIVDGCAIPLGCLATVDPSATWETYAGGRYAPAYSVALDIRDGIA